MFARTEPLDQVAKRDIIDEIVFADDPGLFRRDKIDRHFLYALHLVSFRHTDSVRAGGRLDKPPLSDGRRRP